MIQVVTEENIEQAARVHALSWRESHQEFCSKDFIEAHTIETQVAYIRKEMEAGKKFICMSMEKKKELFQLIII